ncbi:MAG: PAS domain S-box protein [Thermoplasmata archaeon]|nr:PAS domain S-box protein [Thermoplasmata archaeon]
MEKLAELYKLSSKIILAENFDELYNAAEEALNKIMNFDSFAILEKRKNGMEIIRVHGMDKPKIPLKLDGKGITIACANEGKTIYVSDVSKNERYVESSPGIKSELCVPILYGSEVIGVIDVESKEYDAFNEEDQKMLEVFSSIMAAGIKNLEMKIKLRESEKNYRSIFENAVEGIYRLDENGKLIEVNPSLERLLGYTQDELKKIDIREIYKHPEERRKFLKMVKEKGIVRNYEVEYITKDGRTVVGNEFAIFVKEGNKGYIDGIIHDITELKKVQEQLEFYNSLMRHDIANKLQIITGYLEILHDSVDEEAREIVRLALNSANNAARIIENVKKMIKLNNRKIELYNIDIDKMVQDIIEEYQHEANMRGVKLTYINNGCNIVKGNEILKEAISNIVWNAILHSGGDEVNIIVEGNKIIIKDNGKGIPEELMKNIFDMGVKGKTSKGSGIGMYLVKKIAEALNGNIKVESNSSGTTFEIWLP